MLMPSGWVNLGNKDEAMDKPGEVIPNSELAKLDGRGSIRGSSFIVNMYNGSGWIITHLEINLTVKEDSGSIRFSRKYQIWCTKEQNRGNPLTSSEYSCDLGEYLGGYYQTPKFEWSILAAYGYKE